MIFALAITGPTASGKTALSIEMAKMLDAEIICLDSMQIYRGMDIGTAKPTQKERAAVPHHMLDFLSTKENYNAENYKTDALDALRDISSRSKIPMFVGGTGLYIDALMARGENLAPESDREYVLQRMAELKTEKDIEALWQRLFEVDPSSAEKTHKNNLKRVVRALEIYEKSGKTKTYFDDLSKKSSSEVKIGMITLDFHNRDTLYERIDRRVDQMLNLGLLDEVRTLADGGLFECDSTAAQAIGYKELWEYLSGETTLESAVENLKTATRRYAKRQLTWFRHERDAYRLYMDDGNGRMRPLSEILHEALAVAKNFISLNFK